MAWPIESDFLQQKSLKIYHGRAVFTSRTTITPYYSGKWLGGLILYYYSFLFCFLEVWWWGRLRPDSTLFYLSLLDIYYVRLCTQKRMDTNSAFWTMPPPNGFLLTSGGGGGKPKYYDFSHPFCPGCCFIDTPPTHIFYRVCYCLFFFIIIIILEF